MWQKAAGAAAHITAGARRIFWSGARSSVNFTPSTAFRCDGHGRAPGVGTASSEQQQQLSMGKLKALSESQQGLRCLYPPWRFFLEYRLVLPAPNEQHGANTTKRRSRGKARRARVAWSHPYAHWCNVSVFVTRQKCGINGRNMQELFQTMFPTL